MILHPSRLRVKLVQRPKSQLSAKFPLSSHQLWKSSKGQSITAFGGNICIKNPEQGDCKEHTHTHNTQHTPCAKLDH